jgi:hypothetical protein
MTKLINKKHFKTCLVISASVIAISLILPEIALASRFDIDAGVKAATDPIINPTWYEILNFYHVYLTQLGTKFDQMTQKS